MIITKDENFFTGAQIMNQERDIEKSYPKKDFVAKLRRLADSIENGTKFEIQIAGERVYVPVRAVFSIEHEREGREEEIEFQIRWENE
ncbi:MAG: amphi-Trp domain-containing protein [Desulfobacterales bacterium]|nr:amphi-Trp domain-containing protein [Desulfobacterales bacterium]